MTTDINFPPFLETILLFPFYLWRRICGLEVWWEVDIGHSSRGTHWSLLESYPRLKRGSDVEMSYVVFREIASAFGCPYLIRSNFIKTTYDISLDSWISFLPLGFSPTLNSLVVGLQRILNVGKKERKGIEAVDVALRASW